MNILDEIELNVISSKIGNQILFIESFPSPVQNTKYNVLLQVHLKGYTVVDKYQNYAWACRHDLTLKTNYKLT